MRVTLEYIVLIRRTVWRCARPCSRVSRHRDEVKGLRPAICPTCHGPMKLFDSYYLPRTETHDVHMDVVGFSGITEGMTL